MQEPIVYMTETRIGDVLFCVGHKPVDLKFMAFQYEDGSIAVHHHPVDAQVSGEQVVDSAISKGLAIGKKITGVAVAITYEPDANRWLVAATNDSFDCTYALISVCNHEGQRDLVRWGLDADGELTRLMRGELLAATKYVIHQDAFRASPEVEGELDKELA